MNPDVYFLVRDLNLDKHHGPLDFEKAVDSARCFVDCEIERGDHELGEVSAAQIFYNTRGQWLVMLTIQKTKRSWAAKESLLASVQS